VEPLTNRLSFSQKEDLEKRIPELRELRVSYIELCGECARATVLGDTGESEKRRQLFLKTMARRQREILESHGIEPDSLRPAYQCPLCRDTGIMTENGQKRPCICVSEKTKRQRKERFLSFPQYSDFDDELFADKEQLASAMRLRAFLQDYAQHFPDNPRPNLLLFGNTGLGKTFFLGCLTRALSEKGVRADYIPAYALFESFHKQHLGEGAVMQKLSRLPFLAIDDLGVEPMYRNITIEYFNELIDLRYKAKLPTATATNLNPSLLTERYGERIASRLLDQTFCDVIGLRGKDLRRSAR